MKQKGILFLLIGLLLTAAIGYLYSQKEIQYGLDVKGGVRFTYQIDTEQLTKEQKSRYQEISAQLLTILQNRVSQSLGVVEGNVMKKGEDQFIVELPGFTNPEKARQTLNTTASIKFYHAKNVVTEKAFYRTYQEMGRETENGKSVVTFISQNNPGKEIKPGSSEYKKIIEGWDLILQGSDLKKAEMGIKGQGEYQPNLEFSKEGAKKMEGWCKKNFNSGEKVAAVLDNQVLSIAPLAEGAVISDKAVIQGDFETTYLKNLVTLLNSGALPVDLKEISSQTLDPTIGTYALDNMIYAGMVSIGIICAFLLVYYLFPGIIATLALCLYILFTLTALKWMGATFSLAAIAGFILSVGIAVDANILVFERVKEELRSGSTLLTAIELGFKRALPAIIDSNTCTILTSLVLAIIGTGAVKGFASTLIIGLLISLFTAVTVTRSLLMLSVTLGVGAHPKWFGLNRQWFGEGLEEKAHHEPLKIVNNAKRFFIISAISIIPGLIFLGMGGLKPNVEFQGGYEAVYSLHKKNLGLSEITNNLLKKDIDGVNVKILTSDNTQKFAYVTIPPLTHLEKKGNQEIRETIAKAAGFELSDEKSFTEIGPTVQKEAIQNALWGIVVSCILIVMYLAFRFGGIVGGFASGLRFSVSAIGALLHDVLFVVGTAAIVGYFLKWEISALFITAMLTVIGFSVHDSIVIFDRIRENLAHIKEGETFEQICNRSITQTFARSINTSMTVVITLVVMLVIGSSTPDLKFFCLTMLLGIISGTYSSIYNAAPILWLWDKAIGRKQGEKAMLVPLAIEEKKRKTAEFSRSMFSTDNQNYY